MQTKPQSTSLPKTPRTRVWSMFALLGLIGACCGVEIVLIAADYGVIGTLRWRGLAYQHAAFWAGLLSNWRPNYAGQSELMFVTYAFLHSGIWHLLGNMLLLFLLGGIVHERVGQRGFLLLYAISAIGGAAVFGIISTSPQPMVGASGAIAGLVGAWTYWEWLDDRRAGRRVWPIWSAVLMLVVFHVLWLWMGGLVAWETHLGGFIAGWLGAVMLNTAKK